MSTPAKIEAKNVIFVGQNGHFDKLSDRSASVAELVEALKRPTAKKLF